jgi:hypothetical protein
MSDRESIRHFAMNHQNQPLELHLRTGLVVLGPRQEAEIDEADLETPQLEVLQKSRLLTMREVRLEQAGVEADATNASEESSGTVGKRRSTSKKEG